MRAKDIMTSPVITVGADTSLKEVASILVGHEIGAVPVVSEGEELIGIVSEADLMQLETTPDPRSHILPVRRRPGRFPQTVGEVMTREVVAMNEEADVAQVARVMLERRLKVVPIVLGRDVVGIVSRRDVLKVLARSDREIHVELEDLLDDELLMLGRFRAEVEEGVVILRGPKEPAGRRLAELLASSVPGVISVRFAEEPAAVRAS
jgi:CBS domain-containing protein